MRFDDRLATVLALPREDAASRVASWRQIVDILAQATPGGGDPLSPAARALLRELHDAVPRQVRIEALAALAGRRVHPGVVALVANDSPAVAGAVIGQVRLEDGEWLRLLPRLSITARALLRRRRDLSPIVLAGLASFGASDFALPPADRAGDADEGGAADEARPDDPDAFAVIGQAPVKATAPLASPDGALGGGIVGGDTPGDIAETLVEAGAPPASDIGASGDDDASASHRPDEDGSSGVAGGGASGGHPDKGADVAPVDDVDAFAGAPDGDVASRRETTFAPGAPPPGDAAPPDDAISGDTSITDMIGRIAAYRREDAPPSSAPPIETFRFETGIDGVILWVEGAPRAALIGVALGRAGAGDAQVADAVRGRMPFRDAHLTLAGGTAMAGAWRIAGVPVFDPAGGRFTGYRGTARRPRPYAEAAAAGLYGTGLAADALRQLVHELRTPLNAIVGFGEMIEQQILGPAAATYRGRASVIVGQGRRLLGVVDDLDLAARAEMQRLASAPVRIRPGDVLRRSWRSHEAAASARGVSLDLAIAAEEAMVEADPAMVERMVGRLLAAAIGLARPGETITARLVEVDDTVMLRLARPALMANRTEAELLAPGFDPDGDFPDAPLLGLGFALRLVRALANAAGGTLEVEETCFVLRLAGATMHDATDDASRRAPLATPPRPPLSRDGMAGL